MIAEDNDLYGTLKCCPFCGGEAYMESCDRLINIGCRKCDYHRHFHGIVQTEFETPVVASYKKGTKEPLEWYDRYAYEKAIEEWNRRAYE